jgi:hypothetical protein
MSVSSLSRVILDDSDRKRNRTTVGTIQVTAGSIDNLASSPAGSDHKAHRRGDSNGWIDTHAEPRVEPRQRRVSRGPPDLRAEKPLQLAHMHVTPMSGRALMPRCLAARRCLVIAAR